MRDACCNRCRCCAEHSWYADARLLCHLYFRRLAYLTRPLLLGVGVLTSGCNEPESMSDYIAQVKNGHSQVNMAEQSVILLPLTPSARLSYQAQAERNPFYWQQASLSPQLLAASETSAINMATVTPVELSEHPTQADCELAPQPTLVLRAIFNEVQGFQKGAVALIQVAGAELYSVKLGQRLMINPDGAAVSQQTLNTPTAADLGVDIGKITAITGQAVTLTPHAASDGCPIELPIVLSLYK